MRKINKELVISILIPLFIGIISSLLSFGGMSEFDMLKKPFLTPPGFLFPIVWTILYILMGISSYIVYTSDSKYKNSALRIYALQLIVNMLWTFFFFNLRWYLFSFLWIILLVVLVIIMIYRFIKINKISGYIQIPYLLWLIFASILNFSIFILN